MLASGTAAACHDDHEPADVGLSQPWIEAKGNSSYVDPGLIDPGSHEQAVGRDEP
jgi:hypothetical protein